jgi:hypothetical protein
VGRKLGEAVGSTIPFLAAGPLGLAGRVGAVGLGVGAGAGEARTRAEQAGATEEQRAQATALGIAPGALEVFAPFRILKRLDKDVIETGVDQVRRALVAGGEEAAQEAASGFAQNLIARGIYKPEQELIEGLGEQAAYGGATGAIVQGLLDLAIGRRARGTAEPAPPEAPPTEPGVGVPETAKQAALFTEEEAPVAITQPPEEGTPIQDITAAQAEDMRLEERTAEGVEAQARVDADTLRDQFDTLEREVARLNNEYPTATPERQAEIIKEVTPIIAARDQAKAQLQQVERRLPKEERGRVAAAPEQMELDFQAPYRSRTPEGKVLGEEPAPAVQLSPEQKAFFEQQQLQDIRARIDSGEMVTPAQMERLRLADKEAQEAAAAAPTPELIVEQQQEKRPGFTLTRDTGYYRDAKGMLYRKKPPEEKAPEVETRVITEDDFKAMGIGPTNKKLREQILGKDITKPKQRATVRQALEDYANGPNRSARIVEGVQSFLSTGPFMEQMRLDLQKRAPEQTDLFAEETVDVTEPRGADTGAGEPSVPPPSERGAPAREPAAPVVSGVGEPGGGVEGAPAGERAEPRALDPKFVFAAKRAYEKDRGPNAPKWVNLTKEQQQDWFDTYSIESGSKQVKKSTPKQVKKPSPKQVKEPLVDSSPQQVKDETEFVETTVKDTIEKITNDFMVGDQVRFGNNPGVVIGLEGDYVRFRPDAAKSPKAYQRVPKSSLTFVARPDVSSTASYSKAQDNKFGEEAGQLNADMGNLIQLLGANMYAANLADVSVKELLQNAFDAVKGAVSSKKAPSLYKSGKIEISINVDDRTISIKDNARGMTPQIVRDAFFTVAGSEKSDLDPSERSGGLGLAKMGFMLGADRLKLDTVRDGVRVVVDTTAKDIANNNFKIVKSPAPKNEHGTTVTVKIPENYIDPKTGDAKDIWFPYSLDYIDPLNKPLIGPVEVKVKMEWFNTTEKILPVGVNFPENKFQKFKVNFEWGSADVYFGVERKLNDVEHQVLSSGVYQFGTQFKANKEKIPYDIIVNVKPNVDARHPDYPFENSRERFKGRLKNDIDSLTEYLGQISRGYEAANLQESFKDIVSMPRLEVGEDIVGITEKLKKTFGSQGASGPTELKPLPKEVSVTPDAITDTVTKKVLLKTKAAEKEKESTFAGEKVPQTKDFLIDLKQDPSLPIFHNNTNVDYLEIGRKFGEPEKFFAELGTLIVEMKEDLAKSGIYGYEALAPDNLFFGGVAIDKEYGGLHLKVPYKAVFVNPFYDWGARTLFGVRQNLLNTMIHEIAHTGSMDHGVAHNNQMIKVEQYLSDEGLIDYYRDAILDLLRRHESTFTAMREAYGKSTTRNTAKSLETYQKDAGAASARGDKGGSKYPAAALSERERQGRGAGVPAVEAAGRKSDVSAGARAPSSEYKKSKLTPAGQKAQATVDAMKGISNEKPKQPSKGVIGNLSAALFDKKARQDFLDKLRVQVAYKGASVERKLQDAYNGKVRDALGNIRPDVFMTAAEHSDTLAVAAMKLGRLVLDKTVGWKAEQGKASMFGVMNKIKKLGERLGDQELAFKLANDAFIARRANALKNLPEKDIVSLPDQAKIDVGLQAFKDFPELEAAFQEFTDFKNGLVDAMVAGGRISKDQAESWKNAADYVPWNRIKEFEEDPQNSPQGYFKGLTNLRSMKKIKGGEEQINNIFDNMVGLSFWMTNSAIRNHAGIQLADAFVKNDLGARQVREGQPGVDPNKTIFLYRDGKREFYEFESIADVYAFRGIESIGGPFLSAFTAMSNVLRKTTTAMPQFALSQLFQDSYRAMAMSGVKSPFAVGAKVVGGFVGAYRGDPTTQKLESLGIVGMYDLIPGRAQEEIEKEFGIRQKSLFDKGLSFMESFSIASDTALRKSVFEQTLKETKSAQFPEGDVLLARYRAQEVINFKRQGANRTVGVLRQIIPFMNAYIQGMDVFYRSMTGRGIAADERAAAAKLFWKTGTKLAALSIIYAMMAGDDEEYEGLRDYEKDKNFILPGGFKVPVAPEVGLLFKVIPERTYRYIVSQGTESPEDATGFRKAIASAAFDALSGPNLTPQAIKPLLEVSVNYSFFTDSPIVGRGMENIAPAQQFTSSTSEVAKMLGTIGEQLGLGISPLKADYIIKGFTGIAGGTLLDITNAMYSDRPDRRMYELPIFKTFMYDKVPGGYKEQYYDFRNRVDQVADTINMLKAQGRGDELDKYMTDERLALLAYRRVLNRIDQKFEDMRRYKRIVAEDTTMSSAEKRDIIDEIEQQENEMLKAYNIREMRKEAGL